MICLALLLPPRRWVFDGQFLGQRWCETRTSSAQTGGASPPSERSISPARCQPVVDRRPKKEPFDSWRMIARQSTDAPPAYSIVTHGLTLVVPPGGIGTCLVSFAKPGARACGTLSRPSP